MFELLADMFVYRLIGLDPATHIGAAMHFFVMDVTKIFFMLVLIIYVMGLFRAFLSPERVREYVRNRPDWQARGMAVTLGAVTPFCSCSSVPLFIGFVEAGIPLGVTFSFLIASPMLGFGLLIGLTISIMQAVTQVNEMTLTFIPKIIAVLLALALFSPWILQIMIDFTVQVLTTLPNLAG